MPTRPEKDIRVMDDKTLMNFLYTVVDRSSHENAGVLKNILYHEFETTDEGRKKKMDAARGYGIDQAEHLAHLRFAIKELHLRWLKVKKTCHKMAVGFEKTRGKRFEQPEVSLPDLWNLGEAD